jgi:hypothetical protein
VHHSVLLSDADCPHRFCFQQMRARCSSWKSPETIRIMHPHSDGMHLALGTCHVSALKEAPGLAGIMRGVCSTSGHCRFCTWHASKHRRPEQSFHSRRTSYAVWRQNRPEGIGTHDGKRSRLVRGCASGGSVWRLSGTSRCVWLGSWKRPETRVSWNGSSRTRLGRKRLVRSFGLFARAGSERAGVSQGIYEGARRGPECDQGANGRDRKGRLDRIADHTQRSRSHGDRILDLRISWRAVIADRIDED